MSKEATISVSMSIVKRSTDGTKDLIKYNRQAGFTVDVTGSSGPYVGVVQATLGGAVVSFAAVGTPGLAWFHNQSETYTVYIGLRDNVTGRISTFKRLLPGEQWPVHLSDFLREFASGTPGTGSAGADQLILKAVGGVANVLCEVFPQ